MVQAAVGILLAAGRGLRFDPSGARLKLLTPAPSGPHAGAPLAVAAARTLHAALRDVIAVVRPLDADSPDPQQQRLHALLVEAGCSLITHAESDRGIGSSLAAGVRAARSGWPEACGWVIALADMPALRPSTIAAVARAIEHGALTAAPVVGGRRGHPVGFAASLADPLLALQGDVGARDLLRRHPPQRIDTDDVGALADIDHPPD